MLRQLGKAGLERSLINMIDMVSYSEDKEKEYGKYQTGNE